MPKSMTPETETAQVKPKPELEKRTRRVFSAKFCDQPPIQRVHSAFVQKRGFLGSYLSHLF